MNLNRVYFAGNLTRDPAVKHMPSGSVICEFGVACNRKYKKGDDFVADTCFMDCVAYAKTGENIAKFFKRGKPIFLECRLKTESWESKEGQKRSKTILVVEEWKFVGGPSEPESRGPSSKPDAPSEPGGDSEFHEDDVPYAHGLPERWI